MTRKASFYADSRRESHRFRGEYHILLGIASGQERDIKSIQVGVMSLDRRFDALEGRLYGMDHRLSTLEKRFDTLEQSVNSRFEEHGKKLDQILLLLNTFIPKPDQET